MSSAKAVAGLKVQMADSTATTYTDIAEVTAFGGVAINLETTDVTHMQSTGKFREHVATLLSMGDVPMSVNFIKTSGTHDGTTGVFSVCKNRETRSFKILDPDGVTVWWQFLAIITKAEITSEITSAFKGNLTLKPTGQPTTTP
jgi:hypothetical protein